MSNWTYVNGTIEVSTLGRTQEEIEYILKTVLRHLPKVTGSEQDMHTYLIKKEGYNSSSSHDEFEHWVKDFDIQDNYIIVVDILIYICENVQQSKIPYFVMIIATGASIGGLLCSLTFYADSVLDWRNIMLIFTGIHLS